ncbi:hypothetical protein ACP4OV_004361 [Aristida adscensionis]
MESSSSPRLDVVAGRRTSRRRQVEDSQGTEPRTSPCSSDNAGSTGAEGQRSLGGNGRDLACSNWTRAFLLMLLVLRAVPTWHHHRGACEHAAGIHGPCPSASPCSSERRWKRQRVAIFKATRT